MKQTRIIMGMPISLEIIDKVNETIFSKVFSYFENIDARFSTYKSTSEISQVNNGLDRSKWSPQMHEIMALAEETRLASNGYFNVSHGNIIDPSGIVKGWAIKNAADILESALVNNFYIEAGGDIQVKGNNRAGYKWTVGIRNPFELNQIIKTVQLDNMAVATSGNYIRGDHIYNPHRSVMSESSITSLTVIGPDAYQADRFATAAYAMDQKGIDFIEATPNLEGYMVAKNRLATFTSGFNKYVMEPSYA
ncbi:MAG: FAD:protein FMN transferase [Candidatus Saccharimonadales bacterium]